MIEKLGGAEDASGQYTWIEPKDYSAPPAEINEAAWSQLYSTTSRSFDPPNTGKIAVKVINHYGDEVLKVYTV